MPVDGTRRQVIFSQLVAFSIEEPTFAVVATTLMDEDCAWECFSVH